MTSDFVPQDQRLEDDLEASAFIDLLTQNINGKMHTGLVCRVEKFSGSGRPTIDVLPVTKARFSDGTRFELPVLPGVPVHYPAGGGLGMTFPLSAGDEVFVSFNERSIDEWKAQGGTGIEPRDLRRFDLSDGVAVSHHNVTDVDASNLVVGELPTGMQMCIGSGQVSIGTPTVELLTEIATSLNQLNTSLTALVTFATATSAAAVEPTLAPASSSLVAALTAPLVNLTAAIAKIQGITK